MSSTGCADSNPTFQTIRLAVLDGLTARAGGGQSTTSLDNSASGYRVTTVANLGDSITLPPAQPGLILAVTNAAAANAMNVFPSKGDSINALGVNAAFAMAANKCALFICASTGQWHTVLTN